MCLIPCASSTSHCWKMEIWVASTDDNHWYQQYLLQLLFMALLKRKVSPCLEGPFSLSEAGTFVKGCWISSAEEGSLLKLSIQQPISGHHKSSLRMSHMTLSWLEISDGPFEILDSFSSYSCSIDQLLILVESFWGCCSLRIGFLHTLNRLHVWSS